MMFRQGRPAAPAGTLDRQHAASFLLDELPDEALELIAKYTSTPTTPATCLLPMVCRSWQAAADRLQLLVDVRLDLAVVERSSHGRATSLMNQQQPHRALVRLWWLAPWLVQHRGSVRGLAISRATDNGELGPSWQQALTNIMQQLTAPQQAPGVGCVLPHLVHLELPAMGMDSSSAFLDALGGCTSLQRLVLKQVHGPTATFYTIDLDQLAKIVAPLSRLRLLQIQCLDRAGFPPPGNVIDSTMTALLQALPSSLEEMQLENLRGGIVASYCVTHLVNLRAWHSPSVAICRVDRNSDGSFNSSGMVHGMSSLTAMTRVDMAEAMQTGDARLQLPNLCSLQVRDGAALGAWRELQGMQHLQQLALTYRCLGFLDEEEVQGLSLLKQLQQLKLNISEYKYRMGRSSAQAWSAAIAGLTSLRALDVHPGIAVVGGAGLLRPLTQLRDLTVCCPRRLRGDLMPEGAQGWAATPVGAVVGAVAAVVGGGGGQLQRLVLRVAPEDVDTASTAARAALPGLVVDCGE